MTIMLMLMRRNDLAIDDILVENAVVDATSEGIKNADAKGPSASKRDNDSCRDAISTSGDPCGLS
jgi:hypothetical protein